MKYNSSDVLMKRNMSEICYKFFTVLGNPTRLAALETLMNGPKSVTEISEALKQEQSMISHNLRSLIDCSFVKVKREGKRRIYSVNQETLIPLFKVVENHAVQFCPTGGSCIVRGDN
jgi:DNA-binding transcriptional ArsR family regulator